MSNQLCVWFCYECERAGAALVTPHTGAIDTIREIHKQHVDRAKCKCSQGDSTIQIIKQIDLPERQDGGQGSDDQ